MTLEVPTCETALTPCFQQIHYVRGLGTNPSEPFGSNGGSLSDMENIQPMCCVIGPESVAISSDVKETDTDCLTERQVVWNLHNFHYDHHDTPTVYMRKSRDGKNNYLVPVVILRRKQRHATLYISTTLGFCRTVQQYSVKGSGKAVTGWTDILSELTRKSFLTGTHVCQALLLPALQKFTKRVTPNCWSVHLPNDIERIIVDPVRVEMVEFAVKLMECNVPHAFAVAELLCSPTQQVNDYLHFWKRYKSHNSVYFQTKKQLMHTLKEQLEGSWTILSETMLKLCELGHEATSDKMVAMHADLFSKHRVDISGASKLLTILQNTKMKGKKFNMLLADCEVQLKKLRIYDAELKKTLKVGTGDVNNLHANLKDSHPKDDISIVTPEPMPISVWLKHLANLLLSEFWLHSDNLNREAVCTLLALDCSLLEERQRDNLHNWVLNNRATVSILGSYKLKDRLSRTLVECLNSAATDPWREKVLAYSQQSQRHETMAGHKANKVKRKRTQDSASPMRPHDLASRKKAKGGEGVKKRAYKRISSIISSSSDEEDPIKPSGKRKRQVLSDSEEDLNARNEPSCAESDHCTESNLSEHSENDKPKSPAQQQDELQKDVTRIFENLKNLCKKSHLLCRKAMSSRLRVIHPMMKQARGTFQRPLWQ
ncbi:hypothetical protein WMY93_011367 [Mugilogobius chulae]|uniref:Uncharacterized protein n=1 Tax=Mugilogobius chulae TaxID=88201 RepID=A0AAW0P852_9GOBI